jgi:esterase/lipase
MLHGGFMSSETSWGRPGHSLGDHLTGDFRLVMFDRRGHGYTADTESTFHFSSMADETAAVIEALRLAPVNVIGYSDGGIVPLHLALTRPDLIRAMVLISVNYHHDALYPEVHQVLGEVMDIAGYPARLYSERSPDGLEHWPVVAAKGLQVGLEEPAFAPEDLAGIETPTLVLAGDDDLWPVAHTVSLYDAFPNSWRSSRTLRTCSCSSSRRSSPRWSRPSSDTLSGKQQCSRCAGRHRAATERVDPWRSRTRRLELREHRRRAPSAQRASSTPTSGATRPCNPQSGTGRTDASLAPDPAACHEQVTVPSDTVRRVGAIRHRPVMGSASASVARGVASAPSVLAHSHLAGEPAHPSTPLCAMGSFRTGPVRCL